MRVPLGTVAHFSLTVKDPDASAKWWTSNFDLDEIFRQAGRVLVANRSILIALFAGAPDPAGIGHLAFNCADLTALAAARDALSARGVSMEDPGDEIGPVAPASTSMGLWFHDIDGYRWELFVRVPDEA